VLARGDDIVPLATTFTRIPRLATFCASNIAKAWIAPFVAE